MTLQRAFALSFLAILTGVFPTFAQNPPSADRESLGPSGWVRAPDPRVVMGAAMGTSPGGLWYKGMAAARREAIERGKPLVVLFSPPWCAFCRKLEHDVLSTATFSSYADRAVLVHLEPDLMGEGFETARALKIKSYPTVVVFYASGETLKETGRIVGYAPSGPFLSRLDKSLASFDKLLRKAHK